ncbi:MAG: hypothetical protein K2L72_00450 [Clostridia bacterium]|nr:hypothetical protein [Clostridia bacterium]
MEKIKSFFASVWKYIRTRGVGFWLLIPAVILSIAIPFAYRAQFGPLPDYWNSLAFALPLLAVAAYAMSFFKYTAKYTGVVMFALELAGLLVFVNTIYYYIADVIFKADDVSIAGIFAHVDGKVIFVFIAYLINIVICIAASFFKQFRTVKAEGAPAQSNAQEVRS